MLHHHPRKYSNCNELYKDGDVLERADELLKLLARNKFDLVIHGHKHIPEIDYEYGLPCFCSGSFSSLENVLATGYHNTFHKLNMKKDNQSFGKIETWEYNIKDGWIDKDYNRFPLITGFGSQRPISELASDINKLFVSTSKDRLSFDLIMTNVPEVEYLIPRLQQELEKELEENFKIVFQPKLIYRPKRAFKI